MTTLCVYKLQIDTIDGVYQNAIGQTGNGKHETHTHSVMGESNTATQTETDRERESMKWMRILN